MISSSLVALGILSSYAIRTGAENDFVMQKVTLNLSNIRVVYIFVR